MLAPIPPKAELLRARLREAQSLSDVAVVRSRVECNRTIGQLTPAEADALHDECAARERAINGHAPAEEPDQTLLLARSVRIAKDGKARGMTYLARVAEEREKIEAERAEREGRP